MLSLFTGDQLLDLLPSTLIGEQLKRQVVIFLNSHFLCGTKAAITSFTDRMQWLCKQSMSRAEAMESLTSQTGWRTVGKINRTQIQS